MGQYIQIEFSNITQDQNDQLIAQLSEIGFEGFEEEEKRLKAFIGAGDYNEAALKEVAGVITFSKTMIEETNWNQLWESSFDPVLVDDFVAIRADFHQPINTVQWEIVITPKMSFGTGHHATTYLMMQQMRGIDFTGKAVLDFGTGTGVLAILAEKLGAHSVLAIDNDDWSIANAEENIIRNNCNRITLQLANTAAVKGHYDIILANINKNVILDNMETLARRLNPQGLLILSGLLVEDKEDVLAKSSLYSLNLMEKMERHNWLLLKLSPYFMHKVC